MQHAREEYAGGSGRGAAGATPASVVVQTGEAGGSPQTLAADPNGVACWKNDENLPAVLRQGFEFYRSIGSKSARITSLAVTELDETHSMVKARWEMLFHKTGGSWSR